MLDKFSINKVLKKLTSLTNPKNIENYRQLYGQLVENSLCQYAKKEPLDLIACDMSNRLIGSLERDNIRAINNPFKNSPYEKLFSLKKFFNSKDKIDILIKRIFDGDTNILKNTD